VKHIISITN